MEDGGDPHWLARYFYLKCERAWQKYESENKPPWSVTTTEIVDVATALMRQCFLPKNGLAHCDLETGSLPELAIKWIAGAHNVLSVEQTRARDKEERQSLKVLNSYFKGAGQPSYLPLNVFLKLAGSDELKPSADELAALGITLADFKTLPSDEKHKMRVRVLRMYEVETNFHPYSALKPERMGKPSKFGFGITGYGTEDNARGMTALSLFTAEQILAMKKAKKERIRILRAKAAQNSSNPDRIKKRKKAQEVS